MPTDTTPQEELHALCSRVPTGNQTTWQAPMRDRMLVLMAQGASLTARDAAGYTPLDLSMDVRNGVQLRLFLADLIRELRYP